MLAVFSALSGRVSFTRDHWMSRGLEKKKRQTVKKTIFERNNQVFIKGGTRHSKISWKNKSNEAPGRKENRNLIT